MSRLYHTTNLKCLFVQINGDSTVMPKGILFYSDTIVSRSSTAGSTGPYIMYSEELFNSLILEYGDAKAQECHDLSKVRDVVELKQHDSIKYDKPLTDKASLTYHLFGVLGHVIDTWFRTQLLWPL